MTEYLEIKAIGDGNCAYNAFALAMQCQVQRGWHLDTLNALNLDAYHEALVQCKSAIREPKNIHPYLLQEDESVNYVDYQNVVAARLRVVVSHEVQNINGPHWHRIKAYFDQNLALAISMMKGALQEYGNLDGFDAWPDYLADHPKIQLALKRIVMQNFNKSEHVILNKAKAWFYSNKENSGHNILVHGTAGDTNAMSVDGVFAGEFEFKILSEIFRLPIYYYTPDTIERDQLWIVNGFDEPQVISKSQLPENAIIMKKIGSHWDFAVRDSQEARLFLDTYNTQLNSYRNRRAVSQEESLIKAINNSGASLKEYWDKHLKDVVSSKEFREMLGVTRNRYEQEGRRVNINSIVEVKPFIKDQPIDKRLFNRLIEAQNENRQWYALVGACGYALVSTALLVSFAPLSALTIGALVCVNLYLAYGAHQVASALLYQPPIHITAESNSNKNKSIAESRVEGLENRLGTAPTLLFSSNVKTEPNPIPKADKVKSKNIIDSVKVRQSLKI